MAWKQNLQTYYQLTKPGIIYGNLLTTIAGFLLASQGNVRPGLFLATLAGVSLVIAGGCVLNNYIDRNIDKKMSRTKNRALVHGTIAGKSAIIYGSVLAIIGLGILALFTNILTATLGILGLFFYVVVYGIAKRRTVHGTVVGSISGALPPVAGYTSVSGTVDNGALILFLILALWQMPHFYAIAMYRFDDYAAAGLPVLPVKKGMQAAKVQILLYIFAFMVAGFLLTFFGYTGFVYALIMGALGCTWLLLAAKDFQEKDEKRWARKVFFFSLLVLTVFSLTLSIDHFLP